MPNIVVNTTISLPPDMLWSDEFDWSPMGATEAVGLTGALILQTHQKRVGGRRITLASGRDTALLTRAQLDALTALSNTMPVEAFPLILGDGRSFNVIFDYVGETPIAAEPIQPGKVPAATDLFITTLRFMEIAL